MKEIFATVESGVVSVEELPDDSKVVVRDYDLPGMIDDNEEMTVTEDVDGDTYVETVYGTGDQGTVVISVNGGIVDVDTLPDGFRVTVDDYDIDGHDGLVEEDEHGRGFNRRVFE